MAPDPPARNGIGIKYEKVSGWRLKARQNERECDVSVVSGLFMALLVTAVAFAAVKFRQLWFRAEQKRSRRGGKRTGRYIRREILGEVAAENRREDRAKDRDKENKRRERERKGEWEGERSIPCEKSRNKNVSYVRAILWNYSGDQR